MDCQATTMAGSGQFAQDSIQGTHTGSGPVTHEQNSNRGAASDGASPKENAGDEAETTAEPSEQQNADHRVPPPKVVTGETEPLASAEQENGPPAPTIRG